MDFKNSTIAIATDDGTMVSSHFGQAQFYEVLNFSAGKVARRERRPKAGHQSFGPSGSEGDHSGVAHEQRHQTMVSPVLDCQAVVVRGMGQGAVEHLRRANLVPVLTSLHTINEVIEAVAADSMDNDPRRIHQHHGQH